MGFEHRVVRSADGVTVREVYHDGEGRFRPSRAVVLRGGDLEALRTTLAALEEALGRATLEANGDGALVEAAAPEVDEDPEGAKRWYSVVSGSGACLYASRSRRAAVEFVRRELMLDADVTLVAGDEPVLS